MEYDILSSPDLEELCCWVNEKLQAGWRAQGGVATLALGTTYTVFYQAIVRENKKKVLKK